MTDRDAAYEELMEQLEAAGLLERYDEDVQPGGAPDRAWPPGRARAGHERRRDTLDMLLDAIEDDGSDG